jgi:hypothetical protein
MSKLDVETKTSTIQKKKLLKALGSSQLLRSELNEQPEF